MCVCVCVCVCVCDCVVLQVSAAVTRGVGVGWEGSGVLCEVGRQPEGSGPSLAAWLGQSMPELGFPPCLQGLQLCVRACMCVCV